MAERDDADELTQEELDAEAAEALPDREALSILRPDVTIPIDPDVAADVLLGGDEEAAPPPQDQDG